MTIEKRDRIRMEKIEEYCEDILLILQEINKVGFYENQNCQKVVAFDVLQIGELVSALTDGFKENHPTIPWAEIKSVRNQIVHHYGAVNQKIL